MSELKRYVIIFDARAGSSYITDCLNRHPEIIALPEIFHNKPPDQIARLEAHADRPWRSKYRSRGRRRFLREILTGKSLVRPRVLGFKTKLAQLREPEAFRVYLEEKNYRVIHLDRRNPIKRAISSLNAERIFASAKRRNLLAGDRALEPFAPSIEDVQRALDKFAALAEVRQRYLDGIACEVKSVFYEDMIADEPAFFAGLHRFLGVRERAPSRSIVQKATPDDLRAALRNHDAIRAHFSTRGYADCF